MPRYILFFLELTKFVTSKVVVFHEILMIEFLISGQDVCIWRMGSPGDG